jgi:hypothetical protein
MLGSASSGVTFCLQPARGSIQCKPEVNLRRRPGHFCEQFRSRVSLLLRSVAPDECSGSRSASGSRKSTRRPATHPKPESPRVGIDAPGASPGDAGNRMKIIEMPFPTDG